MSSTTYLLQSSPNFRDFGGYPTADGRRVRARRLFRSELLLELTPADLEQLASLQIGLVCDLRSPAERARIGNQWPAGCTYEHLALDLGTELSAVQPDRWSRKLADPDFDAEQAQAALRDNYRRMPAPFARDLRELFVRLARPDAPALLVHCAAGKDRTGFVVAMLLRALGVSDDVVMADYLETRRRYTLDRLITSRLHLTIDPARMGPRGREALAVLASVRADFLQAALDTVDRDFGGSAQYLRQACGLTAQMQVSLRDALLET